MIGLLPILTKDINPLRYQGDFSMLLPEGCTVIGWRPLKVRVFIMQLMAGLSSVFDRTQSSQFFF
jgi:hypothetical protein